MTGRRRPGRDRGSVTLEFAAGLPALMVLLVAGLTAVGAVTTKAQCVDAAREGAIAAARGESGTAAAARVAPPDADVRVDDGGDTVEVTVRSDILPVITVEARAVAAKEPVR